MLAFIRAVQAPAPIEKLEKFSGINFKRWQQKMFFYLTTVCLQKFIKEDTPILPESTLENERFLVIEAWKHSDFLCKNYILSELKDDLYNVYNNVKSSKELWDTLEKKYKTKDAGLKKFVATKFLDYKMIDNKPVITQVQEMQVIIHDLLADHVWKATSFMEEFQELFEAQAKGEKLEDLIVRLRIEEDNKAVERKVHGNSKIIWVNIVEIAPTSPKKRKKPFGPKNYPSKNKFKGTSHNCEKIGHKAAECRAPKKKKKKGQANQVEGTMEIDIYVLWCQNAI